MTDYVNEVNVKLSAAIGYPVKCVAMYGREGRVVAKVQDTLEPNEETFMMLILTEEANALLTDREGLHWRRPILEKDLTDTIL